MFFSPACFTGRKKISGHGKTIVHALSIDVEEWFQAEVFADRIGADRWERMESRVERQTDFLLELLAERGVRATFFLLGWVVERHPALAGRIASAGHELACHGYAHTMITRQGRGEFERDLERAAAVIEEAGGRRVRGYRAPTFSVTKETRWALDVLWERGFSYDASIYPIRHDRYGIPSAPRFPHVVIDREGRRLWEFPGPTLRIGRMVLPAAGGGYLRLFPYRWARTALRAFAREGNPAVVFVHPWEFDRELPRVPLPAVSRIRHYGGIARNAAKLRRLLSEFRFAPAGEVIGELDERYLACDAGRNGKKR